MTVAKASEKGSEMVAKRPYEVMRERVGQLAELNSTFSEEDGREIAANVMDKIVLAETLDEIFAANESGMDKAEAFVGQPITVTEVNFAKSDEKYAKGGIGSYVLISAFTDDGNEVQISTGAPNIVASLYRAQTAGLLPARVKITAKDTANGTLLRIGRP